MNKPLFLVCLFALSSPLSLSAESIKKEISKVDFTLDECKDFSFKKEENNAKEGALSAAKGSKGKGEPKTAIDQQKDLWLDILRASDKDQVLKWIAGIRPPPRLVKTIVRMQFRCLLKAMASDAGIEENALLIQNRRKTTSLKQMQRLAKRVQTRRGLLTFDRQVTRSFYRKSSIQASIWKRKFLFRGKNFNIISPSSAQKCHLKAGSTWKPKLKAHRWCWKKMTGEEKEREILLASSAPGISRHHWGSDLDIFGLNPRTFTKGAKNFDEYLWLKREGLKFGFFQPYSNTRTAGKLGYMDERWHWSYYPIASALSDYAKQHEKELESLLFAQWDRFEKKSKNKYFSYIRKHWRSFVFNVSQIEKKSKNPKNLQP